MAHWKIMALGIASILLGNLSASAAFKTISIDGSLGDWDGGDVLYTDSEISDAGNPDASYNTIYMANDATNLYVAIVTDGASGGSITHDWARNLYLDTDTNGSTGYNAGWMSHGYDFLAQYGNSGTTYSLFGFSGGTQATWSWSWLATFAYSYGGAVAEWAIPLSTLGSPSAVVAEFNATGGSAAGESWAYLYESGAKTYTLSVPEPAAIALLGSGWLIALTRRHRA